MLGLRPDADDLATRPMWPRNPGPFAQNYPVSRPVYAPGAIEPATETATQWSPYGFLAGIPFFGGYDELSLENPRESMMAVAQVDSWDSYDEPWPHIGVAQPLESIRILYLPRESSAHEGFAMPTKRGDPPAIFQPPPPYTAQVTPIAALGL